MGVRVLFDPEAPYESRLPPWREVIDALPVQADASRVSRRARFGRYFTTITTTG
jgi:hypothetical protein